MITAVRARMEALVETLKQQLAEVEAEIQQALSQDQEWATSAHTKSGCFRLLTN